MEQWTTQRPALVPFFVLSPYISSEGTPYYLSPEICENKPYNNKWDPFCLFYHLGRIFGPLDVCSMSWQHSDTPSRCRIIHSFTIPNQDEN